VYVWKRTIKAFFFSSLKNYSYRDPLKTYLKKLGLSTMVATGSNETSSVSTTTKERAESAVPCFAIA